MEEGVIMLLIKEFFKSMEVNEGEVVWFDVCIVGDFVLVVEWFKDGY